MPQGYDQGLFRKKPTYNEILSSIEQDADRIELPERTALTFGETTIQVHVVRTLEAWKIQRRQRQHSRPAAVMETARQAIQ